MRANNLIRNSFQLVLVVLFISSCEKNRGKLDLTEQVDFYESNYFGICRRLEVVKSKVESVKRPEEAILANLLKAWGWTKRELKS